MSEILKFARVDDACVTYAMDSMIALGGYEIRDNRSHVWIQALSLMDYSV